MQKFLSYNRMHSALGGSRTEVPSGCPQVSLVLTEMNLGLSPSTARREAVGPASPKGFLQHVSVLERTVLASLTEPIKQCRSKPAIGKKNRVLICFALPTRRPVENLVNIDTC